MGFEGIEEGKKTKMVTPFSLGTWLVHSLAHELAASPEATRGAGEGRRLHEGEAVVEALPLALQRLL